MKNKVLAGAVLVMLSVCSIASAEIPRSVGRGPYARADAQARSFAARKPWHGQYYYLPYGQPTALVVPPTSAMQQHYSWGVSQNLMTPIHHQFGVPGMPSPGGLFYGTPVWPSHTDQFGVYSVRGPW